MIKKLIYLFTIPSILLMGSCATRKTAERIDQNDDVYYSIAQAKEATEVIVQPKNEKSDYVTDNELYGDAYNNDSYAGDYTSRIYRFRNYAPSMSYYNSIYGYNYDPYYNSLFSPYSYYGSPMLGISFGGGNGYYNYNPWRYYGYNYGSNYWGPYSYNNYSYGYGGGYYGNNYGYSYDRPLYSSPNSRPRPGRASDNIRMDRGSYTDGAGGIIRNGNGGNVIQSRGRAERYGDNTSSAPRTSGTRTQTAPRPERVSQSEPQRSTAPERILTAPRQDSGSQGSYNPSNSGGRSGGETGGARPSRGN